MAMDFRDNERAIFVESLRFHNPSPSREQRENPYYDGLVSFFTDTFLSTFPTGFLGHVIAHLSNNGICPEVVVLKQFAISSQQVDQEMFAFAGIRLMDYQVELANAAIRKGRGVIHAPPRSGKTLIQAAVAATLDRPSVLFVQSTSLLDQHVKSLTAYGLSPGAIQGSTLDFGAKHAIAMVQTVYSRLKDKAMAAWLQSREVMQFDEVHHASSASTYNKVALACQASWRLGYSGTPYNVRDMADNVFNVEHWNLTGAFGPPLASVSLDYLQSIGRLVPVDILQIRHDTPHDVADLDGNDWHPVYKAGIVENASRNATVVAVADRMIQCGYLPLVLVNQIAHGDDLFNRLLAAGHAPIFSRGGKKLTLPTKVHQTGGVSDAYKLLCEGRGNILIATKVADEGVDLPLVNALIMAVGGKADKVNVQRAFRPLTAAEGKTGALVVDFDDRQHGVLRTQSAARRKIYRTLGFTPRLVSAEEALDSIRPQTA